MKKFTCPYCKADLKEALMYVEDGCTNYIYYKFTKTEEWQVNDELDGNNPVDCYYACRQCDEKLPDDMQEYFTNNM